jgi:hypothetical protein
MHRLLKLPLYVCLSALPAATCVAQEGDKAMSGMSILGNNDAPKALVIVPWKSSEIGDGIDVANLLDGRARAVDKVVFARELGYYELRVDAPEKSLSIREGAQMVNQVANQ